MANQKPELDIIQNWWDNLPRYRASMPAKGTVGGALVILDRLKEEYILELDHHRTSGQSQIQGVSGSAVQQILARFGEHRPFLSEGGRTNRGLAGDISALLDALHPLKLNDLPQAQRNQTLVDFQYFLVQRVQEYFSQERLKAVYDPTKTTWDAIHCLLQDAIQNDKGGPIAEYLVGAKLALRFPDIPIENHSYSSADASSDRPGDFLVGDTAFHVTIHPTPGHFLRCKENLKQGLRPYLLVPDNRLVGARQNADVESPSKISVESIESFVSQNLDELSDFTKDRLASGFARLLLTYNQRVDVVENDKSLLIEIPDNLSRLIT